MKRNVIFAALVLVLVVSGGMVLAQQQGNNQGYAPSQDQGWFCPWCGQHYGQGKGMGPGQGMKQGMMHRGQGMRQGWQGQGMGPGTMQRWQGQGMGQGMMQGRGMGRHPRCENWSRGQYGPSGAQQQMEPLSKSAAQELARNYVAGNPNLQVGELTEKDEAYEATIVTREGSLVEKLLIDKQTGWMKRAY